MDDELLRAVFKHSRFISVKSKVGQRRGEPSASRLLIEMSQIQPVYLSKCVLQEGGKSLWHTGGCESRIRTKIKCLLNSNMFNRSIRQTETSGPEDGVLHVSDIGSTDQLELKLQVLILIAVSQQRGVNESALFSFSHLLQ